LIDKEAQLVISINRSTFRRLPTLLAWEDRSRGD